MLEDLERSLREIFTPPCRQAAWEWAEENIILSLRQTETPGPYSTLLTPYVREPIDAFRDRSVRSITLVWGSQTSKTTVLMVGVAYRIVHAPAPVLWVLPNETLAGSFSENRWQPMVDDCAPLAERKTKDRHKWRKLEQQFLDCTLSFVGSNSPANLASRPAGLLIMDEVDKFAKATDAEASALLLAENRTKSFSLPLVVKTSTPTTEYGEIWREWLKGDQRYYFVPCPHCGNKIRLQWPQVKWDPNAKGEDGRWDMVRVKNSAHYVCQECGGKITDAHKTSMLRAGEWRPTNPGASPGDRSYHLNSLYAPWRSCGFGALAVKFLQAKESLNGLQDFINSTLAEAWDEDIGHERTAIVTESYDPEEAWPEEVARFLTADVQEAGGRHYWVVVRAWARSGESRLVWAGKLHTFEEIQALAQRLRVKKVAIDIAHATNEVCQACVRFGWLGMWGAKKHGFPWPTKIKGRMINRIFSQVQYRDPGLGQRAGAGARAPYIYWANDEARDVLAKLRGSGRWHVYASVGDDYLWQIDSYVKKVKRNPTTGREVPVWYQARRDDHLLDCELMQVILATAGRLIRLGADEDVEASALT